MRKFIFNLSLCLIIALILAPQSQVSGSSNQTIVTAAQVNGTWRYRGNSFSIWALGQQRLKVEFVGLYEYKTRYGPMANTGTGAGIARIEGDTAIFRPEGIAEDEECKITMKFTRGKLIVDQLGICGFGHNVYATGAYRKVSKAKPKFGELDLQ